MKTATLLLAELGATPDEVAAKLKDLGIQGYTESPSDCPIARYLRLCGQKSYAVQNTIAEVYDEPDFAGSASKVPLPTAVIAFIEDFDKGRWPELKAPRSEE